MWFVDNDNLKIKPEHEEFLRNLIIDGSNPGTILHDFDALLNLAYKEPLTLTASEQLSSRSVAEINSNLARPIEVALQRPQQKSYPPIHGLFLLLRASGLTMVDRVNKKVVLTVDQHVYQQWNELNPTERYCFLLETWLLRASADILGERQSRFTDIPDNFDRAVSFYIRIPDDGNPREIGKDTLSGLNYIPGLHNLGLLDLFGMITVTYVHPQPGQGAQIASIHKTLVGDALLSVLNSNFFGKLHGDINFLFANPFSPTTDGGSDTDDDMKLGEGDWSKIGALQPVLQPYFREWKNNVAGLDWAFRDGMYIFKVFAHKAWRRISISGRESLDTLAAIILDSVNFDHDHLYEFTYRTRYGSTAVVTHPYIEDAGKHTDEMRVGDIPLQIEQSMIFMFDYGDNWEFLVVLEHIDPKRVIKKPKVIEKEGRAPQQYRSW